MGLKLKRCTKTSFFGFKINVHEMFKNEKQGLRKKKQIQQRQPSHHENPKRPGSGGGAPTWGARGRCAP